MYNPGEFIFFIFSCNRFSFLKNLVKSIKLFYPQNKVIIYDDNSDEAELLSYYRKISNDINFEIILSNEAPDNVKHAGLYNLMTLAIQRAWQENYRFAFFIQDDMQFLQQINLSLYCETTFKKWQNALMISPLFFQKIYLPRIKDYIENKNNDYVFRNRGLADVGIIHLQRAKRMKLTFNSSGEKFNGTKYFNLGQHLVLSCNPCLSWVPWSFSHKSRIGDFIYKKSSLFVDPISRDKKLRLKSNTEIPFLEDYTKVNVNWIPKPYIYTILSFRNILSSYLSYWKYLIQKKIHE